MQLAVAYSSCFVLPACYSLLFPTRQHVAQVVLFRPLRLPIVVGDCLAVAQPKTDYSVGWYPAVDTSSAVESCFGCLHAVPKFDQTGFVSAALRGLAWLFGNRCLCSMETRYRLVAGEYSDAEQS